MLQIIDSHTYYLNLNNLFCKDIHQYVYMKRYNCNETIYKQGEIPYNLYILLSGQLKQIGQKHTQIMDCLVGEFIGAHANFANICYFETMQAFTSSEILVINFDYMQKKLEQHQNILNEVVQSLIKKRRIMANISDQGLKSNRSIG